MALVVALMIGLFTSSGVYLLLRADRFRVVLGLTLLSYAVNLFILASGRLRVGAPPLADQSGTAIGATNPLSQALILTAIVISFGMTAWLIGLSIRQAPESPPTTPPTTPPTAGSGE
ncbi:MAG: Na+/H+ antiporter subunit C [Gemmatimonadales bacterium]|nr:Na+/H+ antiporter subunit C [Gemmatimonadales bacterium]MDZ4389296.1 Na+/H+ antiporter subunit C [Gemmatimonadales bacterium]